MFQSYLDRYTFVLVRHLDLLINQPCDPKYLDRIREQKPILTS
jgi:hypothetical protein